MASRHASAPLEIHQDVQPAFNGIEFKGLHLPGRLEPKGGCEEKVRIHPTIGT